MMITYTIYTNVVSFNRKVRALLIYAGSNEEDVKKHHEGADNQRVKYGANDKLREN